jgi:hypothetical protein
MVQMLDGMPTFSGDVTKIQLDFGIAPTLLDLGIVSTFDAAFVVKVRKVNPSLTPSLATEVQSETPTFDEKAIVQVVYNKR